MGRAPGPDLGLTAVSSLTALPARSVRPAAGRARGGAPRPPEQPGAVRDARPGPAPGRRARSGRPGNDRFGAAAARPPPAHLPGGVAASLAPPGRGACPSPVGRGAGRAARRHRRRRWPGSSGRTRCWWPTSSTRVRRASTITRSACPAPLPPTTTVGATGRSGHSCRRSRSRRRSGWTSRGRVPRTVGCSATPTPPSVGTTTPSRCSAALWRTTRGWATRTAAPTCTSTSRSCTTGPAIPPRLSRTHGRRSPGTAPCRTPSARPSRSTRSVGTTPSWASSGRPWSAVRRRSRWRRRSTPTTRGRTRSTASATPTTSSARTPRPPTATGRRSRCSAPWGTGTARPSRATTWATASVASGDEAGAHAAWEASAAALTELGHPDADAVRVKLGSSRASH